MLAHSLLQCFDERPGVGGAAGPRHVTDPRNSGGLRVRSDRPIDHRATDKRDEVAPSHGALLNPRIEPYHTALGNTALYITANLAANVSVGSKTGSRACL